jgi:hypothetical protein
MPDVSRRQFRTTGASDHGQQDYCVLDLLVMPAILARPGAKDGEG